MGFRFGSPGRASATLPTKERKLLGNLFPVPPLIILDVGTVSIDSVDDYDDDDDVFDCNDDDGDDGDDDDDDNHVSVSIALPFVIVVIFSDLELPLLLLACQAFP